MKLICLNIWGGHIKKPLLNFVSQHKNIDFFCFQEVYHNAKEKISTDENRVELEIFSEIQGELSNHKAFFRPIVNNIYGIGMLIHKDIDIICEGDVTIHENNDYIGSGPTHSRNLQWVKCSSNGQIYTILNVHGLWNGMGKNDSLERIAQSKKIKTFIDSINTPKILCGDFNLKPNTESIKIIKNSMQDLISEYAITSTRSSLYLKEDKFADYIFSSNDVIVKEFKVLQDVVSDHLPLLLEFNLK